MFQDLVDEARFWGAFGFYTLFTLVREFISCLYQMMSLNVVGSVVQLSFFYPNSMYLPRIKLLTSTLKTGIPCIWVDWGFYHIPIISFYASSLDLLSSIGKDIR